MRNSRASKDGRFVEIGKRDIYTDRRIGLRPFAHGITVAAVDLGGMMTRRPRRYAEVLREAWRLVDSGVIAALPTTVHDFAAATAALAALADDERIGKIVLARPATVRDIAPEPLPDGRFRADGTYLITGGHGALGRSLADHLLAHGAGSVALLGRGTYPVGVSGRKWTSSVRLPRPMASRNGLRALRRGGGAAWTAPCRRRPSRRTPARSRI
ncbi:zinc-binding dehydrogenase [Nocardia farcinica]|nr:zinc-binding dehydrogenase [Nocardia farcinica]